MEKNPNDNAGTGLEHLVEGQFSPDATQPIKQETRERLNTIHELNTAFGEKLGGKVLINKKDGRAVEFVEFVSENGEVLAKLRQLGGSTTELVDQEHFRLASIREQQESEDRKDEKPVREGDFISDEWDVIEVVGSSQAAA